MEAALLEMMFRLDRFDLVFMIVRDPVRRLQSEYLWRTRNRQASVDGPTVEKWATTCFTNFELNHYLHDNHIRPQADFYLPDAKVYHFEEGLSQIVDHLDETSALGLERTIPRVRDGETTAGQSSQSVEITPGLRDAISDFYHVDYERFDYLP
jgi:hypothetical protein